MSTESIERLRYTETIDPVHTDGRDIDGELAEVSGEAAGQHVTQAGAERLEEMAPAPGSNVSQAGDTSPSYYGMAVLKTSVWSLDVPLYYYVGGAAGAALTLGAAIQFASRHDQSREMRDLSARCHWIGIAGSTLGAAFLIHDLGRPSRFLYMMRVFRPTSPMNMGAWILAGAAPTAIATGLLINRKGWLGTIGEVCGYASGVFGAALAGYTGVLVASTVIPIWQESRRWMPVLFVSSAAATAASLLDVFHERGIAHRITAVFGTAGRLIEIAAAMKVEHLASGVDAVGKPFRRGVPGALWKAATALTAASLVVALVPLRSTGKRRVAGVLGALGSLCLRLAVHYLSNASARDPRATFDQQRLGPTA